MEVLSGNYTKINWMRYGDKKRWYADPFILSYNAKNIIVLAEEYDYSLKKGRLARLTIDRNTYELVDISIILELTTHLSFPMIFRYQGNTFILPENSASGKSILYSYDDKSHRFSEIGEIINKPLTDAVIFEHRDKIYMFATEVPNENGNKLSIYELSSDNFKATEMQQVVFDSCIARNGGIPLEYGTQLFRIAQDCNGDYGRGVILQKIKFDSKKNFFSFENSYSLYPFTYEFHKGLHTLNSYNNLFVLDARGYLYPHIGRIARPIINILHKIGV